ncbi:MAG TPA: glutathione S-transferase family protein [Roseiarcus sp.]
MRLYYYPTSANSRRVLLTAILLGTKLDLVIVDLLKAEHRAGAYLRINPNGKVPLLDDGGFHLWESHAIMQYLADLSVGQALYPEDTQPRADVNRWLFWCAYHFTPAVGFISRERVSKKMVGGTGAPDSTEIARGEALLAAAAQVLNAHLADRQWIAQNRLTLADLAIASPLMHTEAAQLPVTHYEHLQRWFAQVRALDAWKRSEPARARELRESLLPS